MNSVSGLLLGLTAASFVTQADAFWRTACSVAQTGRIDPILSPGHISGHVHKLSGASNVDFYSTNDTLQSANCTSCEVQQDKSAYWTPQLYFSHSNGSFEEVPNYGMTVYYLPPGSNATDVVPFPPGFKMVAGDATLRSFDNTSMTYLDATPIANRVTFHCIDSSGDIPEEHYMFRTQCDNGMRAQILFPPCWDGVNLYKSDQSHVAYMSDLGDGLCPPTHPVSLPLMFFEVLYWTIDIDQSAGGQFVFAQGDTTGYGFHGDFLNGWDQDILDSAVADCLISNVDGTVDTCAVLEASDNVNFPRTCVEQPPVVPEAVHGMLSQLPGCNPMSYGPSSAPQVVCDVNSSVPISTVSIGPPTTSTSAYSYSIQTTYSQSIFYPNTTTSLPFAYTTTTTYTYTLPTYSPSSAYAITSSTYAIPTNTSSIIYTTATSIYTYALPAYSSSSAYTSSTSTSAPYPTYIISTSTPYPTFSPSSPLQNVTSYSANSPGGFYTANSTNATLSSFYTTGTQAQAEITTFVTVVQPITLDTTITLLTTPTIPPSLSAATSTSLFSPTSATTSSSISTSGTPTVLPRFAALDKKWWIR